MSAGELASISSCPYFQHISREQLVRVAGAAHLQYLERGDILFDEQESSAGLVLVISGFVHLCRFARDGREQILLRCGPGETLNDAPAFDGGPNAATAVAECPALVWVLPRASLLEILDEAPQIARAAVQLLAQRLRQLVDLAGDLALVPVPARIARLLLRIADPDGFIAPDLTQQEIAEMTGTVRQVANRAIADLARDGVVHVEHRRLRILQRDKLQLLAGNLCGG